MEMGGKRGLAGCGCGCAEQHSHAAARAPLDVCLCLCSPCTALWEGLATSSPFGPQLLFVLETIYLT